MKISKRVLALLLCLVMVLSFVPAHGFAADGATNVGMEVEKTEVNIGDTLSVTVSCTEMTVESFTAGIKFDRDLLEITSIVSDDPDYPDAFGLYAAGKKGSVTWSEATAVSTVAQAKTNGQVGFARAGTTDTDFIGSVLFTATFTAKASGTAVFTLYEDSSGTDGYKNNSIATKTVTIGSTTPSEPEHECADTNKDHVCDNGCDVPQGTHGSNAWHICEDGTCNYCGKPVKSTVGHKDDDNDHSCDYGCSIPQGEHADGDDANHTCDYCGEAVEGDTCVDNNKNHECDECGAAMGEHKSNAQYPCVDGICEYCKETIKATDAHKSEDKDHNCDVCGTKDIEGHTEATKKVPVTEADCENAATFRDIVYCTECEETLSTGNPYPSGDPLGHTWGTTSYSWSADNSTCTAERICEKDCKETETVNTTGVVKTPANCSVMGVTTYTADFTVAWAEDQTKDVQDIATNNNHNWQLTGYTVTEETHTANYVCANNAAHTKTGEAENHEYVDGKCVCESTEHVCAHDHYDITATTHQSICSCGDPIGEAAPHDFKNDAHTCVCGAKFTGWEDKTYYKDAVMLTGWQEIDGAWYYLNPETGVRAEGLSRVPYPTTAINGTTYAPDAEALAYCEKKNTTFIDATEAWFLFDDNGKFVNTSNGYIGRGDNQGKLVNGMLAWHPGLIEVAEGVYAYFIGDVENGGNIGANGDTYITKNNGIDSFKQGDIYNFANGELSGANGVKDGKYYQNSRLMLGYGLTEVDGKFIYVRTNGQLATGAYYISNLANYTGTEMKYGDKVLFDAEGYAVEGIVDGKYYVNGKLAYNAGVVEVEEGKYIYVRSNGIVVVDQKYWITNVGTSGLVAKEYTFDADGYIQNPEFVADQKNGVVDGYYYVNGNIAYGVGLTEYNGGYIYVRSNGQVATGKYWVTNTNGLMDPGYYTFGADGMMIK